MTAAAHLSDETIFEFAAGRLDGDQAKVAHVHLDGCPNCRRLLAAASQSATSGGETEETSQRRLRALELDLPVGRGTLIGRYLVRGVLGAGAMGVVYSAWDPELDRCVAIKLVHESAARAWKPEREDRLRREARAMARLVHGNVVHVYDVGEHGARTFIAMEYIEGRTLSGWLREAPRSTGEVVDCFLAAGRGLSAAHEAGLLHRDFKPDNVFVAHDGRVVVGDFGLAREVEQADPPGETAVEPRAP